MLDPFGIDPGRRRRNPQFDEEVLDDAMFPAAFFRELLAGLGQKDRAIRLLRDELLILQSAESFGDSSVGDAKVLGYIRRSCFAFLVDEIGDQFHVILGDFGLVISARALKGHNGRRSLHLAEITVLQTF
jgi:hypothetical protein